MQQFQDDILRTKQMAVEIENKLTSRIDMLEKRITRLEEIIDTLSTKK
ncbi:MAG TPA: hypothetical protein VE912_21880 [Bacteroidales bacterium]|nr:hypothetical protein [Bacteroidales bacterium]